MYYKSFYHTASAEEIIKSVRTEGFNPIRIIDDPDYVYQPHTHPETKLLVFLKGDMKVTVGGTVYDCVVGDKLIIPGGVEHSAKVGKHGCEFFWSEKMI